MSNYIPIRIKSDHSILKGFGKVDEYIERVKELDLPGLGFAERSTGSSIYKFLSAGKKADLKIMPGVEFYIQHSEAQPIDKYLITLYAKNNDGLKNLYKLMITSFNNKEDYKDLTPYITLQQLNHLKNNLYVLTGYKDTYTYEDPTNLGRMRALFGDDLYIAVEKSDDKIIEDADNLGVKIIPSTQTLFAYEKHKSSCDIHLAIGARTKMDETSTIYGGFRPESRLEDSLLVESRETGAHLKNGKLVLNDLDPDIYKKYYDNLSEMINNINIDLEFDTHLRPAAVVPDGVDKEDYLRSLVQEGFDRLRKGTKFEEESKKRIELELDTILGNDYIDYFIVVADYCQFAKEEAGGVGAGRGSAGGSEVAYLLGIHDTDPLQHDLLFERFLSVGRSSEYTITMEDGQDIKHLISDKHKVDNETLYTHQLEPGMKTEEGTVKEIHLTRPTASAVDIDTDFHTQGRAKVLDYTKDKYGEYNVSNVITFMTYRAYSSIKAVCSVLGVPYYKANTISKVLPPDIELPDLVKPSNEANKQLKAQFIKWCMQFGEKLAKEIFKHSIRLQGRIRSEGMHACAVLIAPTELYNVIPMQFSENDGSFLAQWEYSDCEAIGLVKMDFLGLVTVDLIDTTIENVNENYPDLHLDKYKIMEDLNDKETLEVFANANTSAIFQFSSDGVKDFLQELKPDNFEDLYAVTALYRPGPMGMGAHKSFTRRKEGKEPRIPFSNEKLIGTTVDEVLATTYGLIPFQESLMAVARTCAGFTPLETDLLRKATGKKIASLLDTLRPKFKEEFKKNINKEIIELGRSEKDLLTDKDMDEIWKSLEDFASYSFNKSHSVSYSINAYIAAYLKAHYPNEFMAAAIRQRSGSKDKIEEFIREARDMGLSISTPDINSSAEFTRASKDKIILGMDIISGVGSYTVKDIMKEREANGPFKNIADCVQRLSKIDSFSKKVMDGLAGAGALDSLNVSRKAVIDNFPKIKSYVDKINKGTMPLTSGLFAAADMPTDVLLLPDEEYSYLDKLSKEQEVTGFFISGHPLDHIGEYDLDGVGYKLDTEKMLSKRFKPRTYKTIEGENIEAWTYPFLVYVLKTERYNLKNGRTVSKMTLDTGSDIITTFADKSRENEPTIQSMTGKEIVEGRIYVADLSMSNRYSLYVSVVDIKEVELDHDGKFVRVNELSS